MLKILDDSWKHEFSFPFMKTGHTLALASQMVAHLYPWLAIYIGDISLEQCFKINGEILSGPLALLVSSTDS